MKKMKSAIDERRFAQKKNRENLRSFLFAGFIFLCLMIFGFLLASRPLQKVSAKESQSAIERALYAREEFFGAEAIVPLPTAQARENLSQLAQSEPNNPQILGKLAELEEKLSNFDAAEQALIHLTQVDG